jgi:hypothetical protein
MKRVGLLETAVRVGPEIQKRVELISDALEMLDGVVEDAGESHPSIEGARTLLVRALRGWIAN